MTLIFECPCGTITHGFWLQRTVNRFSRHFWACPDGGGRVMLQMERDRDRV